MNIRDGIPDDASAIESLGEGDVDAARLLRDRRVLVAERGSELVGFVSYDVSTDVVQLTHIVGEGTVIDALLVEPLRFGENEDLPIEIVVPETESKLQAALETVGFEPVGSGPPFHGKATTTYRYTT